MTFMTNLFILPRFIGDAILTTGSIDKYKDEPAVVLSYPESVDVLGGTKNINAKKFREVAKKGLFLHIEMGLPFRERLLNDQVLRRNFMDCFQAKK